MRMLQAIRSRVPCMFAARNTLSPSSRGARRASDSDCFDPGGCEQVDNPHAEVTRQPGQAMDRQVLATCFEPRQIPRADPEPLREGLARPPAPLAQLREPKADVAEQVVGVVFLHPTEGAPTTLAKR